MIISLFIEDYWLVCVVPWDGVVILRQGNLSLLTPVNTCNIPGMLCYSTAAAAALLCICSPDHLQHTVWTVHVNRSSL